MLLHKTDTFQIYFGSAQDSISKQRDCIPASAPLLLHPKFKPIADRLTLKKMAFLNQVHGTKGMFINNEAPAFDSDGDFLITVQKNVGIGIMAADCLPIVFYDSKKQAAAIAHAGWRGSVAGIAHKVVKAMGQEIGTQPADLQIFFGPAAKQCCYIVDSKFADNLAKSFAPNGNYSFLSKRSNSLYFNLPEFNVLQLEKAGVLREQINCDYNFCTICDLRFFSHRRQGEQAGRQMSMIVLE